MPIANEISRTADSQSETTSVGVHDDLKGVRGHVPAKPMSQRCANLAYTLDYREFVG